MKKLTTFVLALACVVSTSGAQDAATTTDPVVTHFREYRAALERNDLAAADAAAAAALQASEAVQGRRTAVLALNLASLRLGMGDPARALEPATRAHELATSGGDSGVDPLHASLILGRAELAAQDSAGAARLREGLAAAEAAGALGTEAYDAAIALGAWAMRAERYQDAAAAWASAGRLAENGGANPAFNRGRARLLEGVAIFLDGVDSSTANLTRRSRDPSRTATPEAHAADAAFAEAIELFGPYAYPNQPSETLTVAQEDFAQALGWRGALHAKLRSQEQTLQPPAAIPATDAAEARYCRLRTIAEPMPTYPSGVLTKGGVGAVTVLVSVDAEGNIIKRQVAAVVPTGPLGASVEAALGQWRFERHPSSAPGCPMRSSYYSVVQFVLEN